MSNSMLGARTVGAFVPYSAHINETTLTTRHGDLVRAYKVQGVMFETCEQEQVLEPLEKFNIALRAINLRGVALWAHTIQKPEPVLLEGDFINQTAQRFHDDYQASLSDGHTMASELYLTVVYKPNPSRLMQWLDSSVSSSDDKKSTLQSAVARFDDMTQQLAGSLSRFGLTPLSTYKNVHGVLCSEALELFNYLITGEHKPVAVPNGSIYDQLGNTLLRVGSETIEITTPSGVKYAQCIELKDYNSFTEAGILDSLYYEGLTFVITQSFALYDRHKGEATLRRQRSHLLTVEDGADSQVDDIGVAIEELINGEHILGEYHFVMAVFSDSVDGVRTDTRTAIAAIEERGFVATVSAMAVDAAYFSQLPANFTQRPRVAHLTSRNFAGLCSLHSFQTGKAKGNPWGNSVIKLKTVSNRVIDFNFHLSGNSSEQADEKLPACTAIVGKTGGGKTVLMNSLLMRSQQYDKGNRSFSSVYFDKDQGARNCIETLGGRYFEFANGADTGFNPCQLEPTAGNVAFNNTLVRYICTRNNQTITTADERRIASAINTVMTLPFEHRRFSVLLQNITQAGDKENSISKRLSVWCKGGALGWVFDNETDTLDFNVAVNVGIDGTHFLDNEDTRTPITMYLLHKLNSVMDGRRLLIPMDEAWKYLNDDAFRPWAADTLATIRKKNGVFIFATQSPSTVLNSAISAQLTEQTATSIYLPNVAGRRDEYVDGFGLTEMEYQIIKNFGEDSRMFLVKQGATSYVAKLDLTGVDMSALVSTQPPPFSLLEKIAS